MSFDDITSPEEVNIWLIEYKNTIDETLKKQLRNFIVLAYLPFVKRISFGLARRSTDPVEDLVQVGSLGLLKALEQYDINFGASFKTYAAYLITSEIRHYIRDKSEIIRAPRELQELAYRINQIVQKLTVKNGKVPDDYEIAQELQVSVNRVIEVNEIENKKNLVSLDTYFLESDSSDFAVTEKIIDNKYQDFLVARDDRLMLISSIKQLDPELALIVKLSFFDDMTQAEISKYLNISQMQVSRRLKRALSALFKIITQKFTTFNMDK